MLYGNTKLPAYSGVNIVKSNQLMKNNKLPWCMLASLYMTQYVGLAFILSASVAILRHQGVPLDKLALLNLVALPLAGKVLYAPIIDKYRPLVKGHYRSWLVISNASMALLLVALGSMNITEKFMGVLGLVCLYTFFMSIQDISVDGLSVKLFKPEQRQFASSVQFSGNLFGNIIGGGILLILYPWLEWQGSFAFLAVLTFCSLLFVVFYKEPENTKYIEFKTSNNLYREIKDFLISQKHWCLVLVLYPLISTWGFALLNPILVDNDWSLVDIGFSVKVFGSIIGVFSALLASPLIATLGRSRSFMFVLCLQVVALYLMVIPALGYTNKALIYFVIGTHFLSFPALLVVSATIFIDKAAKTSRRATFFTFQASFATLFGFVYSWATMAVAKYLGYSTTIMVGGILSMMIVALIWSVISKSSIIKTMGIRTTASQCKQ